MIDGVPFTIAECRELLTDIEAALRAAELHAVVADQADALQRLLQPLYYVEEHTASSVAIRARDNQGHPVVVRRGALHAWHVESAACFNEVSEGPLVEGRIRHGRRWWGRGDIPGDAAVALWRVKGGG